MAAVQQVLVLSPHPDDESLGCGGTLKLISSSGGQVDVLYMTRGESGVEPGAKASPDVRQDLARRRSLEAQQACGVLGARNIRFLDGRDGQLATQADLSRQILEALTSQPYHSVFCPWPNDAHTDHRATYQFLHRALGQYGREVDLWLYEVWLPLESNIAIAIDATIEAKLEAIRMHKSQMELMDYAAAFRGLAQYRALSCPSARFAEAFFTCDSPALLRGEGLPWLRRNTAGNGG